MRIIQIVAVPEIETWSDGRGCEHPGVIQTTEPLLYGLGDDGKLYVWGKRSFFRPFDEKQDDITDKRTDGLVRYYKHGWREVVNELAEPDKCHKCGKSDVGLTENDEGKFTCDDCWE